MGSEDVVVLDTNILVSALGWRGSERRIYRHCRAGELRMATSPALLAELKRVLKYPKLRFTAGESDRFEADILTHASVVTPAHGIQIIDSDMDDNRVLECAVAAKAGWIVTGHRPRPGRRFPQSDSRRAAAAQPRSRHLAP